uniref:Uncharacterized protein n=1 Tax=Meloidogyne enterolobii TaxID=390850 RepID=A0A6V7W860_MELEN|nr:unnamed protein product [Meloidogyne enterolobii]
MLAKILVAIVLLQLVLESVNAQEGYPVGPIDGAVTTDCPHKKGGEHHKGHGKEKKEKKPKGTKKPKKPKKGGNTIPPNVEATTDGGEIQN